MHNLGLPQTIREGEVLESEEGTDSVLSSSEERTMKLPSAARLSIPYGIIPASLDDSSRFHEEEESSEDDEDAGEKSTSSSLRRRGYVTANHTENAVEEAREGSLLDGSDVQSEDSSLLHHNRLSRPSIAYGAIDLHADIRAGRHDEEAVLLEEVKVVRGFSCKHSLKVCGHGLRHFWKKAGSPEAIAVYKHIKVVILFALTVVCTVIFAMYPEEDMFWHQLSVSRHQPHELNISGISHHRPIVRFYMTGSFLLLQPSPTTSTVTFRITNPVSKNFTDIVKVLPHEDRIQDIPEVTDNQKVDFSGQAIGDYFLIDVTSTTSYAAPVSVGFTLQTTQAHNEVIYGIMCLVFVYILIIFELVHRTLAAILGSLASLAVLAALDMKPSLTTVLTWLDYETICLLFGMMVLVAVFCETGFFDWFALQAYKIAKGKTWPLITILCFFSAFVSAFLDNVTTVLLLTPVTIRLCEVLELEAKHVLLAVVMFSNIGGTATAIGDPPNVIIVSSPDLAEATDGRLNFATFSLHMAAGTVFALVAAYGLLRVIYYKKELLRAKDPPDIAELKHEIEVWKRSSTKIAVASREDHAVKDLLQLKIISLENLIQKKMLRHKKTIKKPDFTVYVKELEKKYIIQDKVLLVKSLLVLFVVIVCFFIHSFVTQIALGIGWIAILGAIWLLVLSDYSDLEGVLDRIEWATLIFFAALFVLMEALTELGVIAWIASQVTSIISMIDESARLTVALIVILWISALVSCFIDNIPFTTAMLPVVIQLGQDKSLGLPMQPLVIALAFGACLGGNGTLVGSSCNIVCAGIAETHGHGFTFWEFFKVGFPMMLVTVTVSMAYLIVCHIAIGWNG